MCFVRPLPSVIGPWMEPSVRMPESGRLGTAGPAVQSPLVFFFWQWTALLVVTRLVQALDGDDDADAL